MSRVVFVTVMSTKKRIWNEQMGDGANGEGDGGGVMGMDAMKGATSGPPHWIR
jgi:hypothetical protein